MIDDLRHEQERVLTALRTFILDADDRDCVLRYEKLAKLLLSINRQLAMFAGRDEADVDLVV